MHGIELCSLQNNDDMRQHGVCAFCTLVDDVIIEFHYFVMSSNFVAWIKTVCNTMQQDIRPPFPMSTQ